MNQNNPGLDEEAVEKFSELVWTNIEGAMTMALCFLGDQLGLYQALAKTGTVTSDGLAAHTGLHERWLREWLHQQACAGLITYEGNDRFSLTPAAVEVMVNEEGENFIGDSLTTIMTLTRNTPNLQNCFETGLGLTYDDVGLDCARTSGPLYIQKLITEELPLLDGVVDKLEKGALVADIGCGVGTATILMAQAFPQSEFHGYDTSQQALEEARQRKTSSGLTNLYLHDPTEEPLPDDSRFHFVTTFDVVHDTTDPEGLIAAIYQAIRPDGTWLITDISGKPSFEENLNDHPLAAILYAFSVMLCMSSGLSEPGGAGLGTVGFHEEMARQMTREAGFTYFRSLEIEDILHNRYEVRP